MIQPAFSLSQKHLADEPYWHALLHYRRNLFGFYQSEIDDASFFLSKAGRRNPEAELDATLIAFFGSSSPAVSSRGSMGSPPEVVGNDEHIQPAQCRFPARYAWLKEQLGFSAADFPQASCERYDKWKSQIAPQAVSLVFASSYMNNPSSMYGHTFLLLKKSASSEKRLLDYVVNFAADLEHDNGVLYALKGLAGGYHGRFSTFPYYMKVQEYNNLESRDLWEYELHLTTAERERLVQHLWELGNIRIRYFFLNKNCSYQMMPLMEIVKPGLHLKNEFVLRAIPIDTLRTFMRQPGLVGGIVRRPSHASKLMAERSRLNDSEIMLAEDLQKEPQSASPKLQSLPPVRQAMIYDSAYDLFRYKVGFAREQPISVQEKEQQLLQWRNQLGVASEPVVVSTMAAPHVGHKTQRLSFSYGVTNHSHFEELSVRPSIHDQEDPPEGYLPGSKLEMFHTKLRYDNDRKTLYVQQFDVIDLLSLTPWDRWIHPPSWKVNSGVRVANDLDRDPENSLYYGLTLGSGYSFYAPKTKKVLFFGMGEMELELGHAFNNNVRFGGGPSGGILWYPVTWWRARFQASYYPYATGGTPATTRLGFYQAVTLAKDLELRAKLERQNNDKEVLLSLAWYL